ncbi:MAG: DUF5683 domain-containing protein [Dysgonamonadaceae bacterium]|nr:DUF5683 domain-containing protein [Dysgonamonadaceae bacterium]
MKIYSNLIMIGFCLFSMGIKAQDVQSIEIDSARNADAVIILTDTIRSVVVDTMTFKPNSTRSIIYSAIVPGLGQIYNRKYWKLPLVYGSFIGCFYAINWNNGQYTGYKRAFMDFNDNDEATTSWKDYVPSSYPKNIEEWTADQKSKFGSRLQSSKDYYRYYRDMSWIITIGVYAVWIIDAYVDAQLFDFDVSPDLSMRVAPVFFDKTPVNSRSFGLQLCFTF